MKTIESSKKPAALHREERIALRLLRLRAIHPAMLITLILFCLTMPQPVQAATYYVDQSHPNANDSNSGTEAYPWKTLTKAGNTARAGDTVLVKAGIYNETLTVANSGTQGNLITFKAYPGYECQGEYGGTKNNCQVVIDGENTRGIGVYIYPQSYIRIEGFEIKDHNGDTIYVSHYYNTQNIEGIEIANNYIHDNSFGVYSRGPHIINLLVENNEIFRNHGTAIQMGNSDGAIIRGNNIHYNDKDGLEGRGQNIIIERNTIYNQFHTNQHQDAMAIGYLKDSVIRYNIFSDNTQLCYISGDPGGGTPAIENVDIYGNIFYNDEYWSIRGGETQGIHIHARGDRNPQVKNINIYSNTFGWLGYAGIWIHDEDINGVTIRNNIFYECGIDITSSAVNVNSDYNLFYNSNKPSYEGRHSITGQNPQFVNYQRHSSHNFHLQPTSPAIDVGDPNLASVFSLPAPFKDIDAITRPQGSRYDIGAYEYQSNSVLYGDVSGDGTVNIIDVTLAARYVARLTNLQGDALLAADVNSDASVNILDIILIARRAVGLITSF